MSPSGAQFGGTIHERPDVRTMPARRRRRRKQQKAAQHTRAGDRFVERAVTDEIMYELMEMSGREYVDMYAQKVKNQQAGPAGTRTKEPAEPIAA